MRAMETAGRAVVFSGTTVAIGLLALIALPLPFLRSVGYGGMLIPLMSVARRADAAAGGAALGRRPPRLAAPSHRRPRLAGLDALGARHRAPPRDRRGHRPADPRRAHRRGHDDASRASRISTRSRRRATRRPASSRSRTRASAVGALLPNEVLVRGGASPDGVASALGNVDGIHGAIAPADPSWRAGGSAIVRRLPAARRLLGGRPVAGRRRPQGRARAGRRRARRRPAVAEQGLHRRRLRQLPADARAHRDHHVPAARARVPLAAAAR